jgi:hypothetical protein
MIIRTSNSKCRAYVEQQVIFKSNNIFSENRLGYYVVYSYGHHFPMFIYDKKTGQWYENSDKYSVSTSKQQGQARPYNGVKGEIIKKTTRELVAMVE